MALNPYTYRGRDIPQPGADGSLFKANLPGYRSDEDRMNRAEMNININDHDVLNIKYGMDPRLPVLFRYGFAHGYNQLVIPKGRIVAVDPHLKTLDTDTLHYYNVLTLANGGKNVKLGSDGKLWEATDDVLTVDKNSGYMLADGHVSEVHRAANMPIGILERNEYTRDDDAYNGMIPGPIRTDAIIDLPVFEEKAKADKNPWGSIYGKDLKPGMLVKADENGRVIPSPLNEGHADYETVMGDIKKYEKERQQVIGTIYSTDFSLLPPGSARFAQWALEDRLNWDDYNPYIWPNSNRRGEDVVSNPPTMYQSQMEYPGYPWDRAGMSHDLHMLASTREGMYSPRFDEKHRLDRGIPGLTDGKNAVVRDYGLTESKQPTLKIARVNEVTEVTGQPLGLFTLPDTDLESAKISFKSGAESVDLVKGAKIGNFEVAYCDLHAGVFQLVQFQKASAVKTLEIFVGYTKRGLAGVPTYLDWEGCKGSAKILLQK